MMKHLSMHVNVAMYIDRCEIHWLYLPDMWALILETRSFKYNFYPMMFAALSSSEAGIST